MSDKPNILVIGNVDRSEFSRIRDWLQVVGPAAAIQVSEGLDMSADSKCRQIEVVEHEPDVIIVCQSWPDEFPASDVTVAFGRWPLALWVCCYGAWCASDGRTRLIWPIGVRVPVEEAEHRLNHLWRILTEQCGEPLPLTASRDEAFEFDHCFDDGFRRLLTHP